MVTRGSFCVPVEAIENLVLACCNKTPILVVRRMGTKGVVRLSSHMELWEFRFIVSLLQSLRFSQAVVSNLAVNDACEVWNHF